MTNIFSVPKTPATPQRTHAKLVNRVTLTASAQSNSPSPMADRASTSSPLSQWMTSPTAESSSISLPLPSWIIPTEEVTADQNAPLGNNTSTSSVFQGTWRNDLVAVKVLSKELSTETLHNRARVWEGLKHPYVLQVFGASPSNADPLFLVTQYHSNGSAIQFLADNPEADRVKILFEAALGMLYLHERGLVHGGIKPTNILITDMKQACIADCGMVELQPSGNNSAHRYFSPEAWKGTPSSPSDVFAFAMTALEIFTSTPPWGVLSEKQIFQLVVREGERPDRPDSDLEQRVGLTDRIWGIIEDAWQKEPRLRPNFEHLVALWPSSRNRDSNAPVNDEPDEPADDPNTAEPEPGPRNVATVPHAHRESIISVPPAYQHEPPLPLHMRARSSSAVTRTISRGGYSTFAPPRSPSASSSSSVGTDGATVPALPYSNPRELPWAPLTTLTAGARQSRNGAPLFRAPSTPARWTQSHTAGPATLPARSASLSEIGSVNTARSFPISSGDHTYGGSKLRPLPSISKRRPRDLKRGPHTPQLETLEDENLYPGPASAVILAGALQMEVTEGRRPQVIDDHLARIQHLASSSDKEAQKLVTAGTVSTLIILLKARAVDGIGLEILLVVLGTLAYDSISSNMIYRTNTATTLIEIFKVTISDQIAALSLWCINRICRSAEVASGLIKQGFATVLIRTGLKGNPLISRLSSWCLGGLICSDTLADTLAGHDLDLVSVNHLRVCVGSPDASSDDICAAIYVVARMARTVKIAKTLAKAGCISLLMHYLTSSEHPQVLYWSARAVGCMMRPNSLDMSKALLEAGAAKGLARLPTVLPTEEVEPLASFAFAIQRFSCAEWGGGTRKALVEAGVVDSLLAALRTAADVARPQVLIELALAICLLGDVGGTSIRKEIVNAGGIDILERLGASNPELTKVCHMAATSIIGNVWTRNTASAKAAMAHNWNGGCPDYLPPCPTDLPNFRQ